MAKDYGSSIVEIATWNDPKYREKQNEHLRSFAENFRGRFPGKTVGKTVSWQIADGYAKYMVVKEKPLTLIHIAECDGYRILPATMRGTRLADIKAMIEHEESMERFFARHSK